MEYEIKRIEVWPAIRICFFLFAIFGLLMGITWALVLSLFTSLANNFLPEGIDIGGVSSLALFSGSILWAIFYGVFGCLFAAIIVSVYNLIARWAGGFQISLKAEGKIVQSEPAGATEGSSYDKGG
ncbi:MAG TPA: hypothetical protein EYP53_07260 [Candidatus Latescibacteria bacterium]|nr:hypothetical protein [Candidatus Latescibacterota bacterium]